MIGRLPRVVCANWVYQGGDYTTKVDRATEATLPRLVRMRLLSFSKHTLVDGIRMGITMTVWTSKAQRRTARRVLNELKGPGGDGWILMDTSLAVAIRSDERWNVFGDHSRVFAVGDCNCGCVEPPVKKPDDWAIPPIPKVEREDSTILPQEQLISSEQASFEFTCTSVEEAML